MNVLDLMRIGLVMPAARAAITSEGVITPGSSRKPLP
jgi:hypothetical protein